MHYAKVILQNLDEMSYATTLGTGCIPRNLQYGLGIEFLTQVINMSRIKVADKYETARSMGMFFTIQML
jgi:hypothetical protein